MTIDEAIYQLKNLAFLSSESEYGKVEKALRMAIEALEKMKKGKWIERDDCWDGIYYECSVCKDSFTLIDGNPSDNNYNFCPSCGSYNGGEEDE